MTKKSIYWFVLCSRYKNKTQGHKSYSQHRLTVVVLVKDWFWSSQLPNLRLNIPVPILKVVSHFFLVVILEWNYLIALVFKMAPSSRSHHLQLNSSYYEYYSIYSENIQCAAVSRFYIFFDECLARQSLQLSHLDHQLVIRTSWLDCSVYLLQVFRQVRLGWSMVRYGALWCVTVETW